MGEGLRAIGVAASLSHEAWSAAPRSTSCRAAALIYSSRKSKRGL